MLLSDLSKLMISSDNQRWLFVAFFVAFAIKAPMFPVHTWLPDSAAAGTPATSVLLVSVLDKIGTFGMIRYCLQLFPEASRWATPVVLVLALISIFYGAFAAIASREMLRLIAYTSVSHFGIMVLGHLRAHQHRRVRIDAVHGEPRSGDRDAVPDGRAT